ncbi:TIGR04141 family sporadically distributed protein [Pseudomonas sp. NY15374]|uniref:TIGR04141 family sporadically distributed protein n=1 Tax=Pseudomonas sp. NY15374 TaxID=3400357 RepID=UPI003A8B4FE5
MKKTLKERKEKLSIYLVKNRNTSDNIILHLENAQAPIHLNAKGLEDSKLYIKKLPPEHSPPWTRLFTERDEVKSNAFGNSSSIGAVFVTSTSNLKFILSFGTGHHLINEDYIERDFGLKVTLNSVSPSKLRSLDKASYDHNPLNYRTQSTKEVDIFDLHMNSEVEMLYAVTGASTVKVFGSHVTGRDALTLITNTDLDSLSQILDEAAAKYHQKLPDDFEWVDNIGKVRDAEHIEILDLELEEKLVAKKLSDFWLGEPEIVDWENHVGYSFDLYGRTERHVVLSIDDLIAYLQSKKQEPTITNLKQTHIHINNNEYQAIKTWSAYRCLYAELDYSGDKYVLRNSIWYKINTNFVARIDNQLSNLKNYTHILPPYSHDREDEYNLHLETIDPTYSLLDKKNVKLGGSYDKMEFCDLIKDGTDIIHVKYYRSSSTLSHLFSQGCVSAEAFVIDPDFRIKLNAKLPSSIQLKDPASRPDPSLYKIVYAIATTKKLPEELPFFSKVTLKNAIKTLQGLNYTVELTAIPVDPTVLLKKKMKPNKA